MERDQHHGFPTDEQHPTAKAYLRIEIETIHPGRRFRRGQVTGLLGLFATLTGFIRQLCNKART